MTITHGDLAFREACADDLSEILALLAEIRMSPESPAQAGCPSVPHEEFVWAFEEISQDLNSELVVGIHDARVVAVLQLTTNSWPHDAIAFYETLGFVQSHVGLRKDIQ